MPLAVGSLLNARKSGIACAPLRSTRLTPFHPLTAFHPILLNVVAVVSATLFTLEVYPHCAGSASLLLRPVASSSKAM